MRKTQRMPMACSKSAQAMPNKFVIAKEIEVTVDDFGTSSRLSDPGKGHNFRKHPDQEEVVIVIAERSSSGSITRSASSVLAILPSFQPTLCTPRSTSETRPPRLLQSSDHASDLLGMRWSIPPRIRYASKG